MRQKLYLSGGQSHAGGGGLNEQGVWNSGNPAWKV